VIRLSRGLVKAGRGLIRARRLERAVKLKGWEKTGVDCRLREGLL